MGAFIIMHNDKKETAEETVARLKEIQRKKEMQNLKQIEEHEPLIEAVEFRQKASKNTKPIATMERKEAMNAIIKRLLLDEISQGQALKALRVSILGMKQDDYAKLVSVSRKTISDVENDKGNYTYDVINKVFKPFGLKAGLKPVNFSMFNTFLS